MRLDDRSGDRQPQPRAAGRPVARLLPPVEALEDVRQVLPRDPGAGILQPDGSPPIRRKDAPALFSARGVFERILGQVGDHLLERLRVSRHSDPRLDVARLHRAPVVQTQLVQRLVDELVELERLSAGHLAGLEPGKGKKIVNEPGHARAFLLHRRQRSLEGLGIHDVAPAENVDIAGNRRQWRAQLVGGIGDEVAHLFLGLPADLEGMVDAGGHLVEGDRQGADLITSLRHGDPLFVIAGRQGPGRGGHLVERVERPADDQRTQESGHQQHEQ